MTPKDAEGFTDRDLLIEVYTKLEILCDTLDTLSEQVHGNGQPGLKDRVSKLEERVPPSKMGIGGIGGVVGAAVAVAITKLIDKLTTFLTFTP